MTKLQPKSKGTLYAFINTIPYSIIPLIFLVQYSNIVGTGLSADMASGAVNVVGKDIISGVLFFIMVLVRNQIKGQKTIWATFKSREGIYSAVSGIFGGPIGYVLFNTAFYLAGASFTHMFSSVEPIIVTLYATLIWKRKFKWQVWLGVLLAVIGVSGSIIGSSLGGTPWKAVVGSLLAIGGACAWSVESILMDRAFTHAESKTSVLDLMAVKMIIAVAFNLVIMFPILGAWNSSPANTFKAFGELFTNMDFFWRFVVAGMLILLGRYWFFSAVKYRGATYSNVVYEISVIITPVVALITYGISGYYPGTHDQSIINEHLTWVWQTEFWITSAFVIAGATLVTLYPSKIDRIKEQREVNNDNI